MKTTLLNSILLGCLLLQHLGLAQAPNLGTAANFVLFSSTGAVGNTGALSHFTGNIGTVTGAITINVNVNGVLHFAGSAPASQAAADVFSASNQLDLTSPTFITPAGLTGVDSLGGNKTLYAGVDSFTQNTILDSALILDGQGNANAVFIFKINGTLRATPAAKIVLINGALACNVFWQTSGAVDLAAGSVMRGTILAKNATINMGDGATLEGRALTVTAGAITTTNVLAYTPTGCGSPLHIGPASPSLGSAACYVLFSANGTVSNAGTSILTGDVGSNLGTTTGYDPLFVTGKIHPLPDSSTMQAEADLNTAHTIVFTQPEDIELLFPAQFGQNLVLTPHTYLLNAATALTDTLYLNAEGNPNAVFLIKVAGALSTSVNARVILTNGAQSSKVFWNVEGALSINDSAVMHGTFIVNNGAITMTTGALLNGRALTTTGALSTAAVTAAIPAGTCNIIALSLGLLYFNGSVIQGRVRLEWANTEDLNKGNFIVERSSDARSFETLGVIATGNQSGRSVYHYSLNDAQPFANSYYRLLHDDGTGKRTCSNTIRMNTGGEVTASAFAANDVIKVQVTGATPGRGSICLYANDGRKVAEKEIQMSKERAVYTLEKPAQQGLYLLNITTNGQKVHSLKLMID